MIASMDKDQESTISSHIVRCPQCERPLPGDAKSCSNCGVDLTLFALLAEKAYLEGLPQTAPPMPTPEAFVPRIGEYLLDQGLLTEETLNAALKRQKEFAARGQRLLLGQTLVQMGVIDRETLDRAITRQIIDLNASLQEANRTLERRVTERTAELRRALERLTDINQIKANLISNISHELRTPLAHIKGYIDLITEGQLGDLNEEQSGALDVVQRATERLGSLIEDLIEFSTASRSGIRLEVEQVDLPELYAEIIEHSRKKAEKAGVNLMKTLESDLPLVQADRERLAWVLFQLIDNGIKFTPNGGSVEVKADRRDNEVIISIRDTGVGIPSDRAEEIFEPFHQLDGSPTRRYGGTGLGLALVKIILDSHDAELEVHTQEGQGSAFSFTLPAVQES
jgi:signal transduction histidine kinase